MSNQRSRNRWIVSYTAMYLVCMAACFGLFYLRHKLPIFQTDGYLQHYTVLGYVRQALRDLLSGNGLKMVDFSLGQGLDVLTTMGYHDLLDPLNLIVVLFPLEKLHIAYVLIACLRVYLVGLSLILYARKIGAKEGWTLSCAGIIYAFSGYAVYHFGWHTYFMNAMILLPLLLLGVERVLQDGRWIGYVITVALELVVNYYFAYVNTLIAIAYIVVRLIARARQEGIRGTARNGFVLLGGYLLGAALSAAVFLPEALAFFKNARLGETGGYRGLMLRYPTYYYVQVFTNLFMAWRRVSYWTVLSYAPLAFAGIVLLFSGRARGRFQLMAALALCGAVLCCPLLAKIMCGGSYLSNRWCYALGMFIAAINAVTLPELLSPRRNMSRRVIGALMLLYCAAVTVYWVSKGGHRTMQLMGVASMAVLAALFLICDLPLFRSLNGRVLPILISVILVSSVAVNAALLYHYTKIYSQVKGINVSEEFASETVAERIDDDGVYRVEQPAFVENHAALKGYMGTGFFWSLIPGETGVYYSGLGNASQRYIDMVFDLGGGAAAETAAAVKYYVQSETSNLGVVPYGFEHSCNIDARNGNSFAVYENQYALPLGYAFDAAMSEAEYDALTVDQKQQALLAFAVCDSQTLPRPELTDLGVELTFRVAEDSTALLEENSITAKRGDTLNLVFDAPEDSETWLIFDGLAPRRTGMFFVSTERGVAYARVLSRSNDYYFERPSTAVCLSGGADSLKGCKVLFDAGCTYQFNRLRIVSLPLAQYRENVAARAGESLTDVALSNNRVSGKIAVSGDRVLQIALPYSSGWRAWVDGVERPLFRCGGMYMGLEIGEGGHTVDLRYETPGLKLGAVVTLAALAVLIALAFAKRRG